MTTTALIKICPILQRHGVRQVSTSGFTYAHEADELVRQGAIIGEIVNGPAINACVNCPCPDCYEDLFTNAERIAWEIKNASYLDQALTGTDL